MKFILTELELTASSVSATYTYDMLMQYTSRIPNKAPRKQCQGRSGMKPVSNQTVIPNWVSQECGILVLRVRCILLVRGSGKVKLSLLACLEGTGEE